MDPKLEFKKILSEIIRGNLSNVINSIKKLNHINNKILSNILATLCQLVSKQSQNDIDITNVTNIMVFCCESITNLNETETLNYLRAQFHLLKFLSRKISFPDIVNFCTYMLPNRFSVQLSKDIEDIYKHLTILLHNEIIIPNWKTSDIDTLIKSLNYAIDLHLYLFHRNPGAFFSKLLAYATLLQKNKQKCVQFCTNVIKSFKTEEKHVKEDITQDVYASVIFVIFTILSNTTEEIETVDLAFDILQKYCIKSEHRLYIETFQLFCQLFYKGDVTNEIFHKLNKNFNLILKKYGVNNLYTLVLNYISRLLRNKFQEIENIEKNTWKKVMSIDLQVNYMKMFQIIGYMLSLCRYSDNCTNYCELQNDYLHGVIIVNMSVSLYHYSVRYEVDQIDILDSTAYGCLKDCLKYIEKLRGSNCEKWWSTWHMVGVTVYNIATKFYCQNNYNYALKYYKVFCRYVVLFEGIEKPNLCIENALGLSMSLLGHTYLNLKQYRKALTYLAFGIYVCPELRNKLLQTWCSVKSKAINENVSELTISDVLCNDTEIIMMIYPGYVYEADAMDELLMLELESYSKIWSSKLPINATCKQLLKNCTDPILRTVVLHIVSEKIISLQDEDFIKNLEMTIDMLNKNKKTLSNQICLSVLHFIDYQYKLYVILKKNLTEMNEAVVGDNVISISSKSYEEFTATNDHCDIIPTLYNNKIENVLQLHKILSKSVEIWLKIFSNSSLLKLVELIEKLNLESYIKLMAYEYRLQNFRSETLKCWYVYLNFGLLLEKPDVIVESIGFIVECCGCSSKEIVKLIKKADEQIKQLESSTYNELIINYYINKSTGFLSCNKLQDGLNDLNKAKELLLLIPKEKSKIYESRILHLTSQYLQKSCNTDVIEHNQNYILLSQTAFMTVADYYKSGGSRCSYTLSILFEISLSISWMYRWLRMAREVRCYTSEVVLLTQQMVLPIRTSQFLSILAFTDLFNCQYDDCNVKLTGLNYILCYNNSKISQIKNENNELQIVNDVIDKFDKISLSAVDNSIEMMLDVPMDHKILNTRGSPVLNTTSFKMPIFISHSNCDCFYCLNIDYHKSIFEYIHLEAMFYLKQNNYSKSLEFFKGGLQYFEYIFKKLDYLNSLKELEYLVDLYKKQLKDTYSLFLMDYSFYFIKTKNYEEVNNILNKIFKILGDNIKYNPHFYTEILLLKINLTTAKKFKTLKENTEITTTENSTGINLQKTPDSKVSIAKISPSVSISDESFPMNKPKKNIRMNIFESDDENDEKKSPNIKTENKFVFKSPIKTPEMDHKLTLPKTNLKTNKKTNENDVDKSKLLLKRTRLLTSKLKAEKKPVLQPLDNIENDKISNSTKETKKSIKTSSKENSSNELKTTKTNTNVDNINEAYPKNTTRRNVKKVVNPVSNVTTRITRSRRLDK